MPKPAELHQLSSLHFTYTRNQSRGKTAMATPPHAVCLPFPAQGHITPMLDVAKLLHSRGFHVSFVNTEYNHARLARARGGAAAVAAGVPGFRFATIPDGLPSSGEGDGDVTQDIPSLCRSTSETCLGPFRLLLAGLADATCVVADVVMGFAADAAAELGLPCVLLWTASATRFLCYRLLDHENTPPPLPGEEDAMPSLSDMRNLVRTTMGSPDEYMTRFVLGETRRAVAAAGKAAALLINTFDDLEGEAVAAIATLAMAPKKVYALGPLQLAAPPLSAAGAVSPSLWEEGREEALAWLAGREPGSVVYVNFGSIAVTTGERLTELAWGLATSGHAFLWVVRRDQLAVNAGAELLPPEFLAATAAGRGLVASWCPQREVLGHPAVGAFLTHSGWNSAVEAVCAGVPVISWPFAADQRTNCWCQCDQWGVGVEINDVRRDAVASLVAEVMVGEKAGKEMRRRAKEWMDKAVRAAMPGGPAHRNLDDLLRDVLLLPNNVLDRATKQKQATSS